MCWGFLVSIFQQPLVLGFILGGIAGAIAIFISSWIYYDIYKKPKLEWGESRVRRAHLPGPSGEIGPGRDVFFSSMISVKNTGRTAARNCKGKIVINANVEQVCWYISTNRDRITINREDHEFLEVCGWRELNKRIAPTENGWKPSGGNRDLDLGGVESIKAKIIVTADNASCIDKDITIKRLAELTDANKPLFK